MSPAARPKTVPCYSAQRLATKQGRAMGTRFRSEVCSELPSDVQDWAVSELYSTLDVEAIHGEILQVSSAWGICADPKLVTRSLNHAWLFALKRNAGRALGTWDTTKESVRFVSQALSEHWIVRCMSFSEWNAIAQTPILSMIAQECAGLNACVKLMLGSSVDLIGATLKDIRLKDPYSIALGAMNRRLQSAAIALGSKDDDILLVARQSIHRFFLDFSALHQGRSCPDILASDLEFGRRAVREFHSSLEAFRGSADQTEYLLNKGKVGVAGNLFNFEVLQAHDEVITLQELTELVKQIQVELSPRQLIAWYTRYVLEYKSIREAASAANMNPSTFRNHLKRSEPKPSAKRLLAMIRRLDSRRSYPWASQLASEVTKLMAEAAHAVVQASK